MELLLALALIVLAFITGTIAEKRHYRDLKTREKAHRHIPIVSGSKSFLPNQPIKKVTLAVGSVVISVDHFKRLMAGLRQIFGGEIHSYSSLIDRARREAWLRMREAVPEADIFLNARLETNSIGGRNPNSISCVELVAYATAVEFEKPSSPA